MILVLDWLCLLLLGHAHHMTCLPEQACKTNLASVQGALVEVMALEGSEALGQNVLGRAVAMGVLGRVKSVKESEAIRGSLALVVDFIAIRGGSLVC